MANVSDIVWPPGIVAETPLVTRHTLGRVWKVRCNALREVVDLEQAKQELLKLESELQLYLRALEGALDDYERNRATQALVEDDSEEEDEDDQNIINAGNVEQYQEDYSAREAEHAAILEEIDQKSKSVRDISEAVIVFKWGIRGLPKSIARLDQPFNIQLKGLTSNKSSGLSESTSQFLEAPPTSASPSEVREGTSKVVNDDTLAERPFDFLLTGGTNVPKPRRFDAAELPRVDLSAALTAEEFEKHIAAISSEDSGRITDSDVLFAAKVYTPLAAVGGRGGKILSGRTYRNSPASCMDILRDAEVTMEALAEAISLNSTWQASGILPIIRSSLIRIRHEDFDDDYALAVYTPYCSSKSLEKAVRYISGAGSQHWYNEDLLLQNLRQHIRSLAVLEKRGVCHGNIKSSNIFLSLDGGTLLLSDFVPISFLIREWCYIARRDHCIHTPLMSPEIYRAIKSGMDTEVEYVNKFEFSKHDVFCLGMLYYHLFTKTDPSQLDGMFKSKTKHDELVHRITSITPELALLLRSMLLWSPEQRPSFNQLIKMHGGTSTTAAERTEMGPTRTWGDTLRGMIDFLWEK